MMSSDWILQRIKELLLEGIKSREFQLNKVMKAASQLENEEIHEKFKTLIQNFKLFNSNQKFQQYGHLFTIVKNYIKEFTPIKEEKLELSREKASSFLDKFLDLLILEQFCSECNSTNIQNLYFPTSDDRVVYYCRNCGKNVRVFQKTQFLPIFSLYIQDWTRFTGIEQEERPNNNNVLRFCTNLIKDCFIYYKTNGSIGAFSLFYDILIQNKVSEDSIENEEKLKKVLKNKIEKSLAKKDLYDFLKGKQLFNRLFGTIQGEIENLARLILDLINDSLKSGDYFKIQYAIDNFIKKDKVIIQDLVSKPSFRKQVEKNFYLGLSECLKEGHFVNFENLMEYSSELDVFLDLQKIPKRLEHIKNLMINSIHTLDLGGIIEALRFCNQYNLLEKEKSFQDNSLLTSLRSDQLLMANLRDLFGTVSDGLLLYIEKVMPRDLFDFFMSDTGFFMPYSNKDQIVSTVLSYFNRYSIYGLSVEHLGSLNKFITHYERVLANENGTPQEHQEDLIKIHYRNRTHLISPENIEKNIAKIREQDEYKFYSISMVLLGGLGPQGHGFTYSTPKGELIEICSDIKENEAIIIKYKQFLKQQFLNKLESELKQMNISESMMKTILDYLRSLLDDKELIHYAKKDIILKKVTSFLKKKSKKLANSEELLTELNEKISHAITIILRPIHMVDQFKCRMELVTDDKIKSEDIAKMTSLKEKSHYDVLRERFFFQHVVNLFYKIYVILKKK